MLLIRRSLTRSIDLQRVAKNIRMSSSNTNVRSTTASGSQVYESRRAVFEYLFFHYGDPNKLMPYSFGPSSALHFPSRCAQICVDKALDSNISLNTRALDIGCAVGASTFELARSYNEVIGIDYSQHFIDAANKMKIDGKMEMEILKSGQLFEKEVATVPSEIDRTRVTFQQGDACSLDSSLGQFDVILASNLLCRLPSPIKFLQSVPNFLKPNGCVVLISPYSWLEEYTPVSEWIGGCKDQPPSAEAIDKIMKEELSSPFELLHREDMPFLIREHERKYQYGVSDCTVWKKSN